MNATIIISIIVITLMIVDILYFDAVKECVLSPGCNFMVLVTALSLIHTYWECEVNFGDAIMGMRCFSNCDTRKFALQEVFTGSMNRALFCT